MVSLNTALIKKLNPPPMPVKDEKHDNFRRIAERRTEAILEDLRKLSNLSSPNYEFDDDEVEKIFTTIRDGVDEARGRFRRGLNKRKAFRL